jgi:hypothetical protein
MQHSCYAPCCPYPPPHPLVPPAVPLWRRSACTCWCSTVRSPAVFGIPWVFLSFFSPAPLATLAPRPSAIVPTFRWAPAPTTPRPYAMHCFLVRLIAAARAHGQYRPPTAAPRAANALCLPPAFHPWPFAGGGMDQMPHLSGCRPQWRRVATSPRRLAACILCSATLPPPWLTPTPHTPRNAPPPPTSPCPFSLPPLGTSSPGLSTPLPAAAPRRRRTVPTYELAPMAAGIDMSCCSPLCRMQCRTGFCAGVCCVFSSRPVFFPPHGFVPCHPSVCPMRSARFVRLCFSSMQSHFI